MTEDLTIPDILRKQQGRALSTADVQRIFGFSKMGLFKLCKRGSVPHHRLGDRIKFDPITLLRWWEANGVG